MKIRRSNFRFLGIAWSLSAAFLSGCQGSAYPGSSAQDSAVISDDDAADGEETEVLRIARVTPVPGEYESLPEWVTVVFNQPMDTETLENLSHWWLRCGDHLHEIPEVSASSDSVRVRLPAVSESGKVCDIVLSSGLRDRQGRRLQGARTISYEILAAVPPTSKPNSSGDTTPPAGEISSPAQGDRVAGRIAFSAVAKDQGGYRTGIQRVQFFAGGTLVQEVVSDDPNSKEAAPSVQLDTAALPNGPIQLTINVIDRAGNITVAADAVEVDVQNNAIAWMASVGQRHGASFSSLFAPTGHVLVGFKTRTGSHVDQLRPIWRKTHGDRSEVESYYRLGGSGGGEGVLKCDPGYYVSGVYGTSQQHLNSVGLQCSRLEGGATYSTDFVGTRSGQAFARNCGSSRWVSAVSAYTGQVIDQAQFGCQ